MVAALAMLFIGMFAGNAMNAVLEPPLRPLAQATNRIFPTMLIPPSNAMTLQRRKQITSEYFFDQLKAAGFDKNTTELMFKSLEFYPQVQDGIRFAVREAFRDDVAQLFQMDKNFELLPIEFFEKIGISKEHLKLYWRSHWELPSVGQGFEMYQRLNNLQTPFKVNDLAKLGFSDKDVQTNQFELETLMTTLDIMPAWQKRLMMIAFQPITRVDIRRFVEKGIMDFEAAEFRFRELGNSPEDAKLQVRFIKAEILLDEITPLLKNGDMAEDEANTKLMELLQDKVATDRIIKNIMATAKKTRLKTQKDLTLVQILNSFEDEIFTEEKTLTAIQSLGYDLDESKVILQLRKNDIEQKTTKKLEKEKNFTVADVISGFIKGSINKSDAEKKLDELNLTKDAIELKMLNAEKRIAEAKAKDADALKRANERNIKEQSKADTIKALKAGVIDEVKAIEELRQGKFSDEAIAIILSTFHAESTAKEEAQI